jgi:hypothetical protein
VDGRESEVKDCLQQSKISIQNVSKNRRKNCDADVPNYGNKSSTYQNRWTVVNYRRCKPKGTSDNL